MIAAGEGADLAGAGGGADRRAAAGERREGGDGLGQGAAGAGGGQPAPADGRHGKGLGDGPGQRGCQWNCQNGWRPGAALLGTLIYRQPQCCPALRAC